MATYRTCVADANTQKQELEDTKVNSLRQIHEVIKQSDQVIKTVSGAGSGWPPGPGGGRALLGRGSELPPQQTWLGCCWFS